MADKKRYDLIVVGGGASGMMASIRAGMLGKKVLLLEKNRMLGEKLKITGGGRCNITNATFDIREFLSNYGKSANYLFSSFSEFNVKNTFDFFESRGLPLVTQARNRVFPKTEKALDVANLLIDNIKKFDVDIKTGKSVKKIQFENGKITGLVSSGEIYSAKSYILSTGGMSHPETGSTGDGFYWLRDLGHDVKDPTPTIVPLKTSDEWSHILSGVSLSFMKITFFLDGKRKFSKKGKILFTHFGLSGPLILNSSSMISDLLYNGIVTAKIDAFPDTEIGDLDKKITKIFDLNKNKILKNVLKDIVPDGTVSGISILLQDVDLSKKVHSVTKEDRRKIVDILKGLPISIIGLMDYDRAVVADGGVSLDQIDTKTMRSKLFSNLFITGDLLHINRPSGGYSLQLCWTTGWVAGSNA